METDDRPPPPAYLAAFTQASNGGETVSVNPTELVAPASALQEGRRSKPDGAWIIPFFVVLAAALAFFVWEMAQYTSLIA